VRNGVLPRVAGLGRAMRIRHVAKRGMDRKGLVATLTDLLVAGVMVVFLVRATLAA